MDKITQYDFSNFIESLTYSKSENADQLNQMLNDWNKTSPFIQLLEHHGIDRNKSFECYKKFLDCVNEGIMTQPTFERIIASKAFVLQHGGGLKTLDVLISNIVSSIR
jgi:hypothetical protein